MKKLTIVWKRLIGSEGNTCDRCESTHQAMLRAVAKLKTALRPLGIEAILEEQAMDAASFSAHPLESNSVWIAGKPLEQWLGAKTGSSPCCSVCGDSDCRTLEVDGTVFEAIPESLFIRAGLSAAAAMFSTRPALG